jgi:hypothetical protein
MNEGRYGALSDEQFVIDALVEAVEQGDATAKSVLAKQLLEGQVAHGWHRCELVQPGSFAPRAAFEPGDPDFEEFLTYELGLSDDRIRQVMTASRSVELEAWLDRVAQSYLTEEPRLIWAVLRIRNSHKQRAHLAVTSEGGFELADAVSQPSTVGGYNEFLIAADRVSFPGWEYVGAYSRYEDAVRALKRIGFVGMPDYQMRRSELTSPAGTSGEGER